MRSGGRSQSDDSVVYADLLFSPREMEAWAPPEGITVSEWAERYRMVSTKTNAVFQWTHKAYYTVEVMDAFSDPSIQRITIMASVQSGKTEAYYNMIGYAIDQDAASTLVALPSIGVQKRVNAAIQAVLRGSPALARHLTGDPDDITKDEIKLDNMEMHFVTAGSSIALRNISDRYVFMDEIDDYKPNVGSQGSPIKMIEARSTIFWDRKIVTVCTPTFENGYINIEFKRSDKREYFVPCPYCGAYQILSFWQVKCRGAERGKWPKDLRDPERIKRDRLACYECAHCRAEIDDRHKPEMVRLGTWVPGRTDENGKWMPAMEIALDGTCSIPRPASAHAGFHWNALYSPWKTFSEIAAEYFETKDDPETYKTFVNLWLAEPWKDIVVTASEAELYKARCALPPQTVPQEAVALTCGVDVQKYGFWFVVRAWARDYTSWLVHYGMLTSWDDVEHLLFAAEYPVHDVPEATMRIWRAALDTGGGKYEGDISKTEETYFWLRGNATGRGCRCWGTKGASRQLAGVLEVGKPLDKTPSGKPLPGGLRIVSLDTHKLKDMYHYRVSQALRTNTDGSESVFPKSAFLHSATDAVYVSQILAEVKKKDKRGTEVYERIRPDNHFFDCEVMAIALAEPEFPGGGVNLLQPPVRSQMDFADKPGSSPAYQRVSESYRNRIVNPAFRRRG